MKSDRQLFAGIVVTISLWFSLSASESAAQAAEGGAPHSARAGAKVVVATKDVPPFAFKNNAGKWQGISIELWSLISADLALGETEFQEATLEEMFAGLESGKFDVAIAAISTTPERERRVDFTHPYYNTGLGIAVSINRNGTFWSTVREFAITRGLLAATGLFLLLLFVCGAIFWMAERRTNPAFAHGQTSGSSWLGLWWAIGLLLGNRGLMPVTVAGRIVATIGMIASILLFALLTGLIASGLTVAKLNADINRVDDLRSLRVGAVSGTTGSLHLDRIRITHKAFADLKSGLEAVASGELDAMVHDAPSLRYLASTTFKNRTRALPIIFDRQDYAIALPRGSALRKPLNERILALREDEEWKSLLFRFLGE